jgi:hypothetical protein
MDKKPSITAWEVSQSFPNEHTARTYAGQAYYDGWKGVKLTKTLRGSWIVWFLMYTPYSIVEEALNQ